MVKCFFKMPLDNLAKWYIEIRVWYTLSGMVH